MFNKKLSIRTQQEEVANLTSFSDKSIFQINTSNTLTSNSLIFEVGENNGKIKLFNHTNATSEILSFNNDNITISSNVTINNTLNVSNLNVIGSTTTIDTTTYETENLHIINTQLDGPSLKIEQSYESPTLNNILDVGSLNSSGTYEQKMILDTNGNLNILGNIDFGGNLTNSGNLLIYNAESLKTFLSGKNVTTLNLSLNGEIKINDQAKKFHWSYDIDKSDVSNSIYYTDTNSLSDITGIQYGTGQSYTSHVNITAAIGEGNNGDNLGLLIQNRQRNNAIGFGYNTISQVGNSADGYLNIKSKGNQPVQLGNETTNMFFVFNDKVGVGISSPTRLFQVGENANTGTTDQVIALSQQAGVYLWELSMTRWNKYSGGSGKYDFEIKPNSTNDNTTGNLGNILLSPINNVGIGTTTPSEKLHVNGNSLTSGVQYVSGGTLHAKNNNYMQTGSLDIGSTDKDYGGGSNWNQNMAGLLLECLNNTEIAVHDNARRVASVMHYEGNNNSITVGRDMGWGTISKILLNGNVGISVLSPTEKLTITGDSTGTITSLGLRNGNDATITNDGAQISFGWNGSDSYKHFIQTRHNNISTNNAIDFYVCNGTSNNTVTSGSTHTMSLVSGKVGIGSTTPTKELDVIGDIRFTGQLFQNNGLFTSYTDENTSNYLNNLDTHIIPATNETIDIGSVDKKIRDIYVSNNSIWMGETHKLMVTNDKLKFKKRNKNIIPSRINTLLQDRGDIPDTEYNNKFGNRAKSDILLHEWLGYAKELNSTIDNINEVFEDNDTNYEEQTNIDFWLSTGNDIYLHGDYQNIGIGVTNPLAKLSVHSSTQGDGILISKNNAILGKNENNEKTQLMFWNGTQVYYGRVSSDEGSSLGVTAHNFRSIKDGVVNTTMRIVGDKVGIGNDLDPQYTLDVDGSIRFTGDLYQDNDLFTSYTDTDTTNLINTGVAGNLKLTGSDTFANTVVDKIEIESYFSTSGSGGAISFKNKVYNPSFEYISARIKSISNYANDGSIVPANYYSGHLIFETQFGDSTNTNGVSRDTTERMRITNRGNIGIGTTVPVHKLDVNGDINYTGRLLKNGSEAAASGTIYKGMIVEMKHNDYKKMKYDDPGEWSPIDNDLTTGFVISIKPKSIHSLISLFVNCYISFDHTDDARWWGARLYRKVGNGNWTHVTGAGGNRTGDDADDVPSASGTAVWFGDNNLSSDYAELGNCSATYLDTPNTLETVYYTVYWKCRLGGPEGNKNIALNRSIYHSDAFRAEPISSWTVKEIWNDGNPYSPVDTTISISGDTVGINNTNPQYELDVGGSINFTGQLLYQGNEFTSFNDQDAIDLLNNGFGGGLKVTSGLVGIGTSDPQTLLHLAGTGDVILRLQADTNNASGGEGNNPMIEFRQDGNLLTGIIGTGNLPTGGSSNDNAMYLQHCGGKGIVFLSGPNQDNQSTSTEKMRIANNGNVGIGTTTPSKKLDVNGDVNISGTLTTSNLNVTGTITTINTQTYQSENLEIINTQSDGPSLSILQNNNLNNIIDTSNLSTDKKFIVDKDGLVGINIIPTSELDVNGNIKFSGNINNVSSQSLDYIQNLDEDIIIKISQTSNLLDNKSSNFTNTIYNDLNNKIDNLNVDESSFILDGSQIISGFVNATLIPIDNSSLYIDNGLLKVNPNNDNTELNTFIGKYEKTEEYIENIDTVSNSVTTVDNRIFYETTTLTSNITITNTAPNFFTSQTIYPRDIYNRTVNYTSTTNQWIEGIYTIITNSSDGVFNNNYDTYGSHKVFSHNLTEFYKSSQVFDVSGNYIGSNNFKGTIGLSISIDIGRLIYLRTLKLFPNSSTFNTAMPNNFKIYASNNVNCWGDNSHSSWNLLHNNVGLLQYKPNEFTVFGNFDNLLTKYRYFTLVVTNINGNNTHLELNELSIIGVDDIINQPISIDNETNTYAIKLEYDEVVSETFSEVTIDGTIVSNYNSTNNLTIYNDLTNVSLTFNTQSIVYDVFDTFNTIAEWEVYAQSLDGSTYFNSFYPEGPFASSSAIGYITFPLPNDYNFIVVEFDKTFAGGKIQVLLNNTAVLTTATGVVNNVIYTGNYTENTTFKFQEIESGVLPRNLKVTLINKKEYTLNFSDAINAKVNYNDKLLDTQYTLINGNFDTTNRIINTIIKKTSDNSIIYEEETLSLIIGYLKTKYKQEYNILPPYLNSDLDYLYAYYTFENNFTDSKNSYNLINNNNCVINYDNRLYDNCALYLDGTANIEFPDNINLYYIWNNGDGLTISFWFNMLETTQTDGRMLEFAYQTVKYNNESTHRLGIMKNFDDNNLIQIYWQHLNTNKQVTIQLENSYNNWNHLSFSIDKSGYWYIYLNGKLQSIDATPFQPPNITYNVKVIGRSSYSTSQNFYGYIDDLRFYSKVLDQKEVKILYESIYQTIYTSIFSDIIFADIVLVAGGGSGGGSTGGGGGAGGILYTEKNYIPINNYIFRIGKGGDSVLSDASHNNQDHGNDGINTIAMDTVVFGGGGGGGSKDGVGNPGGSGGGGAFETAFGGSIMTPLYGYVIINGEYYGNVGVSTKNSQISGDGGGGIFNYTINTVSEYYGGVGKGRDSVLNTTVSFDNSTTLGGGGGGGGWLSDTYSGKGGNGIVIIKYYLDKNKTQEYSIETNDDYKVLSGDKVLLNSTLVRRVYNTGDKYFTVFNVEETDIDKNIGNITTFVKLNNILKFNITNTIAEHVVYYSNAQNYTKVVIPRNDIYKININAIFNLEFASEFCKFYIKLERLGYEPRYLRVFYLPPISEYSNNDSATLDVTVDLELLVNDIITFESNYKLSVYKESFLTITSTNKTIIDGTLIQNIYNTSANEAFTFESPLNKLGNTITLDQSQLSFNINFAQPLINNNNTVSIQQNYYAYYTHNHDASDIVSGQLFLDRIPDLTSRHYSNIVIDDKLSLINTNVSNITTYDNSIIKLDYEKIKTPDVEITGVITVNPVISPELESQPIAGTTEYKTLTFTYDSTNDVSGQTTYTVTFDNSTECDILVVAGGGGGSESHGGGGGAGAVIFMKDVPMNGSYNIKIGKGGNVSQNIGNDGIGFKGNDTEIYKSDTNKVIAEGGGAGGAFANGNGGDGGSGGGGDGFVPAYSTGTFNPSGGIANAYTPVLEGVSGVKYGNVGGSGFIQYAGTGGGGGGAGAIGESATSINDDTAYGGVGVYKATISGTDYNFKEIFNLPTDNSIGEYFAGGTYAGSTYSEGVYFGGGGGGGLWENPEPNQSYSLGGLGGGGTSGSYTPNISGENGLNNTGGGGGGGGGGGVDGGGGGSGIVIIRYKTVTFSNKYLSYDFITSKWNTSLLNANDILSGILNQSVLPIATTNTLGCIKVDNTTINIDEYGIISSAPAYGDIDVTNYLLNLNTHIIPDTDNAYDIGSVDKRIRELFVSNNSIWMGDTHKIVIKENKMKFKKINKNVIPTRLQSIPNVNDTDIFSFFNNTISTKEDLTLSQWMQYGKSKDNTIETINDIFEDDDNNFEQEISTDIWQTHTNNIILNSDYQNIGIGTSTPNEKLHIIGNTKIEGTLTTSNLDVIGSTTQINTQTYTSESLLIDNTDADGKSITIYHNNANHDIVSIYTNDTNSTEVFTITKTGFIGISHSTPDFPLHIQSSTGKGIRVDCDDIDTEILRFTPNDTYPTSYGGALKYHGSGSGNENKFSITMDNVVSTNIEAFTILQNGNIGIGKSSPSEKLHVNGNTYIEGKVCINSNSFNNLQSGALSIGNIDIDYGGGTNWNNNIAGLLLNCNNNTEIAVNDNGSRIASFMYYEGANNSFTIGRNMYWGIISKIILNGDIGIGTDNPTDKLTVYDGRIKIHQNSTSDNAVLHLLSNTYNTYLFTDKTSGSFHIRSHNNNNDVIISSSGSLGIGTTPSSALHVHAPTNNSGIRLSTNSQAYYLYNSDNANSGGAGFSIQNITDGGKVPFRIKSSGEILLSPFESKNVGIGTTSPEQKIDMRGSNTKIQIYGNSNTDVAGIRISSNNNNDTAPILYLYANGTGNCCEINSRTNHDIKFLSNNLERMIITNDGKVGIGTMSPTYKLEVSGDINIVGGNFYKDNVLFTGGGGSTVWQTNNNDIYYDIGNVGIGTLTPSYTLDVIDNVSTIRIKSDITSGEGHSILLIDSKNTGEAAIKLATNSQETWKLSSGTSSLVVNNSILVDNSVVNSVYNTDYQKIILGNNGSNQQTYQVNFQNDMKIDILVVGGGGGGYGSTAASSGGGGGGGGILYASDLQVTSGTYTFKVGRGGGNDENGYASEAFGAIANGGSKGRKASNTTSWYGGAGGTTNTLKTAVVFTEYNGGDGGTGTYTTSQSTYPLFGANGPLIDIVGSYHWGGGGGGGGWYGNFGSGGKGGGAGGGFYNNGNYGPATGGTGINNGDTNYGGNAVVGGNGGALTGGGGGGAYRMNGGAGGSGSIIIVYKTTDIIYTPDTNLRLYNSLSSSIFSINQNGNLDVTGDINTNTTIRTPQIDFDDGTIMTTAPLDGIDGTNGLGFTGGSYNSTTGVVTFTSDDGLGFSTGDLRGADGADGADGTNGVDGTNGTDGTNGLGFTGGSYNATTGVVTFTSDDGLGFSTGDLRASYTDADARNAVYPIKQANSGLPLLYGGIALFDNNLWYNTTDYHNRFYFTTNGTTAIRAPDLTNSSISLQIGVNDKLTIGSSINNSLNDFIAPKIGIGTNSPTQILDVRPSSANSFVKINIYAHMLMSQGGTADKWLMGIRSSGNFSIATDQTANDDIIFLTGDVITLTPTKNVGIDNLSPAYKLDVAGDINFTGNLTQNGVAFSNDTLPNDVWMTSRGDNVDRFRFFSNGNTLVNAPIDKSVVLKVNDNPKLVAGGSEVYTTTTFRTPQLDFYDGTSMTSAPFTPSYFKVFLNGSMPDNFTETKQSYFGIYNTLNVGGYTYTSNEITIPTTGVYEIIYNIAIRTSDGGDRQTPMTHIRINDVYAEGSKQAIWGDQVRYSSGTGANNRETAGTGQTILSLTAGNKVSIWAVREGNSGSASILNGSQLNIKRIG